MSVKRLEYAVYERQVAGVAEWALKIYVEDQPHAFWVMHSWAKPPSDAEIADRVLSVQQSIEFTLRHLVDRSLPFVQLMAARDSVG